MSFLTNNVSYPSNTLHDINFLNTKINNISTINYITGTYSNWKNPVNAVTNENITLGGIQTINGVILEYNYRVLVKNQTNAIENGIYIVNQTWQRSPDFFNGTDVSGASIYSYGCKGNYGYMTYYLCESGVVGTSELVINELGYSSGGIAGTVEHDLFIVLDSAVDSQGNLYYTGKYKGEKSLHNRDGSISYTLPFSDNYNMILVKMDPDGQVIGYTHLLSSNIGGASEGISIKIDSNDNVYLAGIYNNTDSLVSFPIYTFSNFPTVSTYELPNLDNYSYSYFIIKWNSSGEPTDFTYAGTENDQGIELVYSINIELNSTENLYATISYTSSDPGNAPKLRTFSNNPSETAFIMPISGSGVYYIIVKWALNGSVESYTQLGYLFYGYYFNSPYVPLYSIYLKIDDNDNVYLTGYYRADGVDIDIYTIDNTPIATGYTLPFYDNRNGFLIKWDSDGNLVGYTYLSSSTGTSLLLGSAFYKVDIGPTGEIYVSGYQLGSNAVRSISTTPVLSSTTLLDSTNFVIKWLEDGTVSKYTYLENGNNCNVLVDGTDLYIYGCLATTVSTSPIYSFADVPVDSGLTIGGSTYFLIKWTNDVLIYFNNIGTGDIMTSINNRGSNLSIDPTGNIYTILSFSEVNYIDIPITNQLINNNPATVIFYFTGDLNNESSIIIEWDQDGIVYYSNQQSANTLLPGGTINSIQYNNPLGKPDGSANLTHKIDSTINEQTFAIGKQNKENTYLTTISGNLVIKTDDTSLNGKDITILQNDFGNKDILIETSAGIDEAGSIYFLTGNGGETGSGGDINIYTERDVFDTFNDYNAITFTGRTSLISGINYDNRSLDGKIKFFDLFPTTFEYGGISLTKGSYTENFAAGTLNINRNQGSVELVNFTISPQSTISFNLTTLNDVTLLDGSTGPIFVNIQSYSGIGNPTIRVKNYNFTHPISIDICISNVSLVDTVTAPLTFGYVIF